MNMGFGNGVGSWEVRFQEHPRGAFEIPRRVCGPDFYAEGDNLVR